MTDTNASTVKSIDDGVPMLAVLDDCNGSSFFPPFLVRVIRLDLTVMGVLGAPVDFDGVPIYNQ